MDNNVCAFSLNLGSSLPVFRPQWMQLKQRKGQMVRLFQRLQDYQFEKVREQPDKALTEDTRPLSEEDIARWSTAAHTHTYMCAHSMHVHTHNALNSPPKFKNSTRLNVFRFNQQYSQLTAHSL